MTISPIEEAQLVDLNDVELKDLLGCLWETIKRIEEFKKNDAEIVSMQEALKNLIDEKYGFEIKRFKAKLAAARAQAKIRGIAFHPKENQ